MGEIPAFFSKLQKDCGAVIASYAAKQKIATTIYAGDPYFHWVTGGFSLGKVNVLYGCAGAGKSTLALKLIGSAQALRPESWVLILDSELYFQDRPDRIQRLHDAFGIDLEHTLIISSKQINVAFGQIFELIEAVKSNKLELSGILIDSWKGFENKSAVKKIIEGKIDEAGDASRGTAKTMNPILDQVVILAGISRALCMITQHVAANQEQYGPNYLLPGGECFRHQTDAIIYVETITASDAKLADGDEIIEKSDRETEKVGKRLRIRADKTRNTVEGKKCEIWFNFRDGHFALPEISLFDLADKLGIITHPVNPETGKDVVAQWMFEDVKIVGKDNFIEKLKDKDFFNKVQTACFAPKKKVEPIIEPVIVKQELPKSSPKKESKK